MKNIYITGITGFLGYNLVKLLQHDDVNIIGFALNNDPNIFKLKQFKNVNIITGNILNIDDVEKFINYPSNGTKYLIHAAGKITTLKKGDPLVYKINFEGTKNIIDCTKNKNFKKIIYVSSVDSMRNRNDKSIIIEQDEYNVEETKGQYGKSKVLASNYVKENTNNYIVVLPSAIIGPDDPLHSAINTAIDKVIKNKMPIIVNGGYNLVDVRDVASGIIKAMFSNCINQYYLLAGHYISIKDLLLKSSKISGSKKYKLIVPHFIVKSIAPFIELSAKIKHVNPLFTGFSMDCLNQNSNYSSEKAKKDFGYETRNLDITITDTINFLKARKD